MFDFYIFLFFHQYIILVYYLYYKPFIREININSLHNRILLCKITDKALCVCSSVDRVAHSECEGRRFKSAQTHQKTGYEFDALPGFLLFYTVLVNDNRHSLVAFTEYLWHYWRRTVYASVASVAHVYRSAEYSAP